MDFLPSRASGNAFIYVLVSVVLLGALSFAISRGNDSNPSNEVSAAAAKASASAILAYESQARSSIDQMIQTGANISTIDFTMPDAVTFNTAPTVNKLFHPDGGGLQYKTLPKDAVGVIQGSPVNGYYIGRFNNYEWTPTTAQDVVFTAYGISQNVCKELNLKITGSSTIPVSTYSRAVTVDAAIVSNSYANVAMDSTGCPGCKDRPSLCFSYSGLVFTYYSLLVAR